MAEQTSNRFLVRSKRLRVASIATSSFPDPGQLFAYDLTRRLCNNLDAELGVAASTPSDPTCCDASAKAWLAHGLFSPPSDLVHTTDLAHFRRTRPQAVDRLFDELAQALGTARAQVGEIPDVKIGISLARWLEVWAPDLLVSFHGFAGSLWAHTAARLLALPRVWITYAAEPDRPADLQVNSLHCQHADLVVTANREVSRSLGLGDADGCLGMDMLDWELQLSSRVSTMLASRVPAGARADLGPKAAFPKSATPRSTPQGITPFVVLGAERTGSNLLIEMLLTHPRAFASGELFNTRQIEEGKLDVVLPKGLLPAEIIELRKIDPPACFDRVVQAAAKRERTACGFKLLYYHALAVDHVVEYLLAMPSLRVVHLVREDALERWISQVRAERSDLWWSATERPSHQPPRAVELDPRETLVSLEFNRQLEDLFRALFAGRPWLERSYEELASDLDAQMVPVQQFLGLNPQPLMADSKKTGNQDPRLLVSNWGQLVEAFSDTRWRGLFPPR